MCSENLLCSFIESLVFKNEIPLANSSIDVKHLQKYQNNHNMFEVLKYDINYLIIQGLSLWWEKG